MNTHVPVLSRLRKIAAIVGFVPILTAMTACNTFLPSQLQSDRNVDTSDKVSAQSRKDFLAAWTGKDASEVQKTFGRPTRIEPTDNTGGSRYFYRESGQPHYIFEFNVRNKVINASQGD